MGVLADILSLERKIAAETRMLYRGVKDILPSKINHNLVDEDGVWGAGTYLSTDPKVASWYAFKNTDEFGVMTKYQTSAKTLLLKPHDDYEPIHPTEETMKLTPAGQKKLGAKSKTIKQSDVANLAQKSGYNAVEIDDRALKISEPMVLLLKGAKVTPVSYSISDWDDKIHQVSPKELPEIEKRLATGLKKYRADHDAFAQGKEPPHKIESWFKALSKGKQKEYLDEHPKSKMR